MLQWLVSLLSSPRHALAALYLLSQTSLRCWTQVEVELVLLSFRTLSAPVDLETCSFVLSPNPLLLSIACSALCKQLRPWSRLFKEPFTQLNHRFLRIAVHFQAQHSDYTRLKAFYLDCSYGGKNAFDLLSSKSDDYRELLMCETVVNIAKDLWRSEEDLGVGLTCPYWAYLAQLDCVEAMWTVKGAVEQEQDSLLQFHVWQRDGFLRHLVETGFLLAMFVVLIYILRLYLQVMHLQKGPNILKEMSELMGTLRNYRTLFAAYLFSLVVNHVQAGIHLLYLGQSLVLDPRLCLDALLVACISLIMSLGDTNTAFMDGEQLLRLVEWLYAVLFLLTGLRILMVLLETEAFGPILRMIFLTVRGVLAYLLIYLLTLFAFALSFTVVFWRDTAFESIEMSIRTMFTWSVGGFDPTAFTDYPGVGSLLGCVWALVSAVLLLNLLVAVLSTRLERLSPQARADYVAVLYRSYCHTRFEPLYGALVVAPAPFNVLTLPALLLYVGWPAGRTKVTQCFAIVSYQLIFAVAVMSYTVVNMLLLPVAYLFAAWRLCHIKKKRLLALTVWLAFGPVQLLLLWGHSCKPFVQFLYAAPTSRRTELSTAFFQPLKRHLRSVMQHCSSLSTADLAPTLTPFPHWHRSTSAPQTRFLETVERIYFSHRALKQASSSQALDFLHQFQGTGTGRVDIGRVVAFLELLEDKPDLLLAINIPAVQVALQRARNTNE